MRTSRRAALEALHAADVSGTDARTELDALGAGEDSGARALVDGVVARMDEVDALIRTTAENWALERMPVVDRNLLRIGVYEIIAGARSGPAINELVELAKLLSTEDSGRFVNGVLGKVARARRA
jgi:N utilization substance protein B